MITPIKKAIILFSGGLDSTTCFAMAKAQGFTCYALSFLYGQKHSIEIERAKILAKQLGAIEHRIIHLPIGDFGGSSLTDEKFSVPDYCADQHHIPSTYIPARNTIFLSCALSFGEVVGAYDIFIGANHLDYSGYPDCRPEYLEAFAKMATLATRAGTEEGKTFKIHAPLLALHKAQIIQEGLRLGIDYSQTISCYRADALGKACGTCDSCTYRKKGFKEADIADPTPYY